MVAERLVNRAEDVFDNTTSGGPCLLAVPMFTQVFLLPFHSCEFVLSRGNFPCPRRKKTKGKGRKGKREKKGERKEKRKERETKS
jgi:hypothetical protein